MSAERRLCALVGARTGRELPCDGIAWARVQVLLGRFRWSPDPGTATGHVLGDGVEPFAGALRRALAVIPPGDAATQQQAWSRLERAVSAAALVREAESFLRDEEHDRARMIADVECGDLLLPQKDYFLAFSGPMREWLSSLLAFATEEGGFRVERLP